MSASIRARSANDNLPAIMDTSTGGCGFDNPVIMTGPSQPPVEFAAATAPRRCASFRGRCASATRRGIGAGEQRVLVLFSDFSEVEEMPDER